MASLEEQLRGLRSGKTRRIRGVNVRRDAEWYWIDGVSLSLAEAIQRIEQEAQPKASGFDYDWNVFLEKTISGVLVKWHRCRSRAAHSELLADVIKRKNRLWYAQVMKKGDRYFATQPHIIDWDSVPEKTPDAPVNPAKWDGGMSCPFCRKAVSSTPGRTLHVKAEHPERLEEYHQLLAKPALVYSGEDSGDTDGLRCPFCKHKCTSTPGRTLHVKAKHPDRLVEYQQKQL